jgi:hypothetical protein
VIPIHQGLPESAVRVRRTPNPQSARHRRISDFDIVIASHARSVLGFLLVPRYEAAGYSIVASGGLLFAAGALGFVYNMWRTFDAADARARKRAVERVGRVLPTAADEP